MTGSNRKIITLILIALLTCTLFACGNNSGGRSEENKEEHADEQSYYDMELHRGGRDARPENTLYSFQYALENGASTIECDIALTKDNELVVVHNNLLDPAMTMDKDGNRIEENKYFISDMTLEEVQSLNVGYLEKSTEYYDLHGRTQVSVDAKIPTLRELFELIRDSKNDEIRLSIEAKYCSDPNAAMLYEKNPDADKMLKEFLSLVKEFGYEKRVALQCFDWGILTKMQKMDPEIETIALYSEQPDWGEPDSTTLWLDRDEPSPWLGGLDIHDFDGDPIKAAASLKFDAVSPYLGEIDKEKVQEAHDLGMKVIPWTVNSEEDIRHMYEIGVDGMITDRAWLMRDILTELGEKLPETKEYDLPYHIDPDHIEVEEDTAAEGGNDSAY